MSFLFVVSQQCAGTLPDLVFDTLPDLDALFLYDMRLSGTIGINGAVGKWAHWMYGNGNLSGTIPNGNYTIYSWRTGETAISGTLPSALLQSWLLLQLDVNEMRLSGTVPDVHSPGT